MLVKGLKEILKDLPDDMELIIHLPEEDFKNVPIEKAEVKKVRFCEDPDDMEKEPYCDQECLILYYEN